MSFYTDNTLEMMMALNSFGPRFDPQSIPSYDDWVANSTFDPFGPEPFLPISHSSPGISLHFQTGSKLSVGKGADVDNRVDGGRGSSEDMARNFPKERSRFAFAQRPIKRTTDTSVSQIPAAHVHQSPAGRSQVPIPIKATPAAVPRVVGPRPFQRASHTRRELILAVPKAVHPLPTWLTHFEDYEEEFLAKFCPPEASSPSTSTFPAMAGVECHPDQCPPLNATPPLGFEDSDSDCTSTDIEDRDWRSKEDEGFDEEDEDYEPFEFIVDSDFGSEYVLFGSGSSTPASYYGADAFDWPTPYQGTITDGEACPPVSAVTLLEFPPQGSSSLRPSSPHVASFDPLDLGTPQPLNFLPWSASTDPFTGAPITTLPSQRSATSVFTRNATDDCIVEVDTGRFLVEIEEGYGFWSGSSSEPTLGSLEGNAEGWYDRFDLTSYTFPVPPQQPHNPCVVPGLEAPPLMYTATIASPYLEEDGDVRLDAVVISPRSPAFEWG